MESVVGIDLSGISRRTKGRTVAVSLALGPPLNISGLESFPQSPGADRLLVDWVRSCRPRAVAIDAPLTLPHSVTCDAPVCKRCEPGLASYLERDVDRDARSRGGAMPLVMLAAIAFRGMYLARQLERRGLTVIETYPAASFRALGAGREAADRRAVLERRLGFLPAMGPDELDATCAALAAADYLGSAGRPSIGGDDGAIWLVLSE